MRKKITEIELKCNICGTKKLYKVNNTDYCSECGAFLLYKLNRKLRKVV